MHRVWYLLILLGCAQQLSAGVLYVPPDYNTIQSAIDAAVVGDTVIVSPGTYLENIDFKGKAIILQSTDPNDPNIIAATIIDGSNSTDPNFGSTVTFASGEDTNSVLTGFTITGGTGSWLAIAWEFHEVYWNRCGGGAVCYNMSQPTISKNVFTGNSAGQGGGVYVYGDPVNPANPSDPPVHVSPVIKDNTFISNIALVEHGFAPPNAVYPADDHGDGGAIVGFQGVDATITGNVIENNQADFYGGGIHLRQWSNGLVAENEITGNSSMLGAGVHITYSSRPTVRDNLIEYNSASSLGGGGIYIYYLSEPLIERNIIRNNTSTNGAGVGVYYSSAGVIRNNLIYKNNAGAGVQVVSSTPKIVNNTIADNAKGGIDCSTNGNPEIINNIITGNGRGWGIWVQQGANPTIKYNNVWGSEYGTTGPAIPDQTGINGNISTNPDFLDNDANDYHLDYYSPCMNAGDPNYAPEANETDYDGDIRPMGQRIDIGADEVRTAWNITSQKDYATIQQAIDDSNDSDVILVTIGTHTGTGNRDIEFYGKAIKVRSTDPNDWSIIEATVIDSNGSATSMHRGFHFRYGEGPNSVVAGLTITGGGGVYDGGAIRCSVSSPTIKNCIITGNFSWGRGAIYCTYSEAFIDNCIITNNTSSRGYGAGVCAMYNASPTITNCFFTNNHAQSEGRHGGAIYCHDGSDAFIANCLITANTAAHRGGGIAAYWSSPTYLNCTIIGNTSLEGGGLSSFRESNPLVVNCIVRDNISPDGNQIALINTYRVWGGYDIGTEMTIMFSDIEGGQAQATIDGNCMLHWGQGNIDIDPNFVDSGYWDINNPGDPNDDFFMPGNYHLPPSSLCIDMGDNNSIPPFLTGDVDGEQRIFDTAVDMGADEMVMNPFDFDEDGIVAYPELSALIDEWLLTGPELQSDFHQDEIIDLLDYAILAEQWLWTAGWYQQ